MTLSLLAVATGCARSGQTAGADAATAATGPGEAAPPGPAGGLQVPPARLDLVPALEAAGLPVDVVGDPYVVPDPLPFGNPGELIRVRPIELPSARDADAYVVMYHSRDRESFDVAVTGMVVVPRRPPAQADRVVVSWAHGTSGMSAACAPSRWPAPVEQRWLDAGMVVAATDYLGLGPPGERHAYLSGITEGRAVIDIARAARQLPGVGAGDRWFAAGHSQGGHAALFAGEEAVAYAPDMRLLGTVAVAPVSGFDDLDAFIRSPIRGIVPMLLFGLAEDHEGLRPADYLSEGAMALETVIAEQCNNQVTDVYGNLLTADQLLRADPNAVEPARTILAANNPGLRPGAAPVLIVHGAADPVIPAPRSAWVQSDYCARGTSTTRNVYDGADHGSVLAASAAYVDWWMAALAFDRPLADGCASR